MPASRDETRGFVGLPELAPVVLRQTLNTNSAKPGRFRTEKVAGALQRQKREIAMDMTRGEMQDLLIKFSSENPEYRTALVADPGKIIVDQFGVDVPDGISFKVLEESADTVYVVLPHVVASGDELSDADLEAVAGGGTTVKSAKCEGGGNVATVISIEAGL